MHFQELLSLTKTQGTGIVSMTASPHQTEPKVQSKQNWGKSCRQQKNFALHKIDAGSGDGKWWEMMGNTLKKYCRQQLDTHLGVPSYVGASNDQKVGKKLRLSRVQP